MILWYIMNVCLSVAWNGLNNVIMIYCLNTVYHAGFFFALIYLNKEVHDKEDKIWGWWHKPMHNHTSVDYICDDDDDNDGISFSGPWQCYLGDTQCYLEKSKSIFHPPINHKSFYYPHPQKKKTKKTFHKHEFSVGWWWCRNDVK